MQPGNTHEQVTRDRDAHGRFTRGRSGNPNGRPRVVAAIRDLAREHGPAAIRRLVTLMHSDDEAVAVAACRVLLDRGYGKPEQAIAVTTPPVFEGEATVVSDPAEAAHVYARVIRGELAPNAVRFVPAPMPALEAPQGS